MIVSTYIEDAIDTLNKLEAYNSSLGYGLWTNRRFDLASVDTTLNRSKRMFCYETILSSTIEANECLRPAFIQSTVTLTMTKDNVPDVEVTRVITPVRYIQGKVLIRHNDSWIAPDDSTRTSISYITVKLFLKDIYKVNIQKIMDNIKNEINLI